MAELFLVSPPPSKEGTKIRTMGEGRPYRIGRFRLPPKQRPLAVGASLARRPPNQLGRKLNELACTRGRPECEERKKENKAATISAQGTAMATMNERKEAEEKGRRNEHESSRVHLQLRHNLNVGLWRSAPMGNVVQHLRTCNA